MQLFDRLNLIDKNWSSENIGCDQCGAEYCRQLID